MAETSASTPLRAWASDWSDKYDQDWSDEKLEEYVGKHVKGHATVDDEPKGFEGWIVGFSVDTLIVPDDDDDEWEPQVHRYSFILAEGLQCPIFAGMEFEETEAPE